MKFLVTAGPTREPIDPVRFLGNRSSGKMGYAIAEAAARAGHDVVLVSGPVCLPAPDGCRVVRVTTADEMFDAVHASLDGIDIAILAAAVADFKPATTATEKIKKASAPDAIALVPTRDILASLGKMKKNFRLVGFAAETENVAGNARRKLAEKNCDAVVANDVSRMNTGFEGDENEVTVFFRDGKSRHFPRAPKRELARGLVAMLATAEQNS